MKEIKIPYLSLMSLKKKTKITNYAIYNEAETFFIPFDDNKQTDKKDLNIMFLKDFEIVLNECLSEISNKKDMIKQYYSAEYKVRNQISEIVEKIAQKHDMNILLSEKSSIIFIKSLIYCMINSDLGGVDIITEKDIKNSDVIEDNKEYYKEQIQKYLSFCTIKDDMICFPNYLKNPLCKVEYNMLEAFMEINPNTRKKEFENRNFSKVSLQELNNYFLKEIFKRVNQKVVNEIPDELLLLFLEYKTLYKKYRNINSFTSFLYSDHNYSHNNSSGESLNTFFLLNTIDCSELVEKVINIENLHKFLKFGASNQDDILKTLNNFKSTRDKIKEKEQKISCDTLKT